VVQQERRNLEMSRRDCVQERSDLGDVARRIVDIRELRRKRQQLSHGSKIADAGWRAVELVADGAPLAMVSRTLVGEAAPWKARRRFGDRPPRALPDYRP
jgi:hypothetical protein